MRMKLREAAEYLGLPLEYFRRLCDRGRGPSFSMPSPKVRLFEQAELDAWKATWESNGGLPPAPPDPPPRPREHAVGTARVSDTVKQLALDPTELIAAWRELAEINPHDRERFTRLADQLEQDQSAHTKVKTVRVA